MPLLDQRRCPLKVELTADAAEWVEATIAAGTFLTPEEAVHHAVSEVRAKLDPDIAEGSRPTTENVRAVAETAAPKRTPQEAAARMLARRQFHRLPEGTTIRDLMAFGRA